MKINIDGTPTEIAELLQTIKVSEEQIPNYMPNKLFIPCRIEGDEITYRELRV